MREGKTMLLEHRRRSPLALPPAHPCVQTTLHGDLLALVVAVVPTAVARGVDGLRVAAGEVVPDARGGGVEGGDLEGDAAGVHVALGRAGGGGVEVVGAALAAVQEAELVAALEGDGDVAAVLVDLAEEVLVLQDGKKSKR